MTPRYRPDTRAGRAEWKRARRAMRNTRNASRSVLGRIFARDRMRERARWAGGLAAGLRAVWAELAPARRLTLGGHHA